MKIKFRLEKFTQVNEDRSFGILFSIIDQDMTHNQEKKFYASNGFHINTNYYTYLGPNTIYLLSKSGRSDNDINISNGCVAYSFHTNKEREEYISNMLQAIDEWSNTII